MCIRRPLATFSLITTPTQLNNNLETYIKLLTLSGKAYQNGVQYAEFDYTFTEDFTTSAGQNPGPYSETITSVKLSAGTVASLTLLTTSAQGLDIVRHFARVPSRPS